MSRNDLISYCKHFGLNGQGLARKTKTELLELVQQHALLGESHTALVHVCSRSRPADSPAR